MYWPLLIEQVWLCGFDEKLSHTPWAFTFDASMDVTLTFPLQLDARAVPTGRSARTHTNSLVMSADLRIALLLSEFDRVW
jgi:hypothetical protein